MEEQNHLQQLKLLTSAIEKYKSKNDERDEDKKSKNREEAVEIFKELTDTNLGDITDIAKYWLAIHYFDKKTEEENFSKAKQLFKELADRGHHTSQIRYAFCLLEKPNTSNDEKIREEFIRYLDLAAKEGERADAYFFLGDLYYHGKKGVIKNQEKGIEHLELAASRGNERAKKLLEKIEIEKEIQEEIEKINNKTLEEDMEEMLLEEEENIKLKIP